MAKKKKNEEENVELVNQLTDSQKLFCELYVRTTSSNKECYMTAFPNSSEASASANASRLLKNPKIIKYINELLDEMQDTVEVSQKEVLRGIKAIAFSSKNDTARLKALTLLGEITGLLDKSSTTTNNVIMITVDDNNNVPKLEEKNDVVGASDFIVIEDLDNEDL